MQAVHATGRRKLILCALWTEVCMAFVALDALREGYEVYPVVDAIGGTSVEAHRAALERVAQAGAQPVSWVSLACELQRDWARTETVPAIVDIVLADRLPRPEPGDHELGVDLREQLAVGAILDHVGRCTGTACLAPERRVVLEAEHDRPRGREERSEGAQALRTALQEAARHDQYGRTVLSDGTQCASQIRRRHDPEFSVLLEQGAQRLAGDRMRLGEDDRDERTGRVSARSGHTLMIGPAGRRLIGETV